MLDGQHEFHPPSRRQPMISRFIAQVRRLYSWYSIHRKHFAFHLLQRVSTLAILAASGWFIWRQLSTGYTAVSEAELSLGPSRLIASWVCIAASTALGAWEWTLLLTALGGHIKIAHGLRIHLVSNLFKYVPGFIWPYVGKAWLATRQNVKPSVAALSVVSEFAIVFFDGFWLIAFFLPSSGIVSWSMGQRLTFQLGVFLLAGLSIASIPFVGRRLLRRLREANLTQVPLEQVNWKQVAFVVAAILLTWCLLGLGFSILATPASSSLLQAAPRQIFALVSALLIGQAVFLIPMGIGIREAVFLALLGPDHPASIAVVIALVFRLEMVVGELFCASIAWFLTEKARD